MRWTKQIVVVALVGVLAAWADWANAQPIVCPPDKEPFWLPDYQVDNLWNDYPRHGRFENLDLGAKHEARTARSAPALDLLDEVEPNDNFAASQVIAIAPEPAEGVDLDIFGTISPGDDVDLYRFTAKKGDIFGLAVLGDRPLDPVVAIQQVNEVSLIENDDDAGLSYIYPKGSPWPTGRGYEIDWENWEIFLHPDASLTWVAPANGDYLIRVQSSRFSSNGTYTLQIRSRRASFEEQDVPQTQTIFLDFDGVRNLDARALYGVGFAGADLSPLRDFLGTRYVDVWVEPEDDGEEGDGGEGDGEEEEGHWETVEQGGWGLPLTDEPAVVDAIITVVEETFDSLRKAGLNGNRDVDFTNGHFDVEILNSRDHPDPFGQPNVSRVIVGGAGYEMGVSGFLGIAESIDPGNFAREETAVVLLDILSAPETDSFYGPYSANSIKLAPGLTKAEAIGAAVGNIIVHEAGHYLGNWHTNNTNDVPCIMDQGGQTMSIFAGAGRDGVLGTGDDQDWDFIADEYIDNEQVAIGTERTDVRSAFALGTGRMLSSSPAEAGEPELPLASVRAAPTSGQTPLTVRFAAGAIEEGKDPVVYTWDFGDNSDPVVDSTAVHVYATPGIYTATLTVTSGDQSGQATERIVAYGEMPTAVIAATPSSGSSPLTVTFEGTGSVAPGGTIVQYAWDFGDGAFGSGAVVAHTFTEAKTYVVSLTVTDAAGQGDTARTLIAVSTPVAGLQVGTQDDASGAPLPVVPPLCGAGALNAMGLTMIGLLGLMVVRRR